MKFAVAPLAGAWIEMLFVLNQLPNCMSLPSRERGLKSICGSGFESHTDVAPLAGAWIEILLLVDYNGWIYVAPLAGAWIEMQKDSLKSLEAERRSPCGSVDWNLESVCVMFRNIGRSPCGSVDWNHEKVYEAEISLKSLPLRERGLKYKIYISHGILHEVAPLAGAWIEILCN